MPWTLNSDYHRSSDATADDNGGTGHLINRPATNEFVSIAGGSEDLHLKTGAFAIDNGTDLSTQFGTDIDGGIRTVPWDIGADDIL